MKHGLWDRKTSARQMLPDCRSLNWIICKRRWWSTVDKSNKRHVHFYFLFISKWHIYTLKRRSYWNRKKISENWSTVRFINKKYLNWRIIKGFLQIDYFWKVLNVLLPKCKYVSNSESSSVFSSIDLNL